MIRKALITMTGSGSLLLVMVLCLTGLNLFAQAPTITNLSPTANAANVSVSSSIVLTFNVSINGATANPTNIKVRGSLTGLVAGSFNTVSNVVTFTPSISLKSGEVVTVTVTNQVIGTNIIAAIPYAFQFTVKSEAGTASFVGNETILNASANGAVDVKAADLDADGDLDVYAAARIGNSLQWYLNTGTGSFGALQQITINGIEAVDAADLNGDGLLDLLVAANLNQVLWYSNNGSGGFVSTPNVISSAEGDVRDVHAVDVDADGDVDVISAAGVGVTSVLRLFTNNGSGTFAGSLIQGNPGTDEPYSIFSADIDKDGDLDILTAGQTDDLISWYENGNSWAKTVIGTTNGASSVYAADIDSDGDMDVLSAARNSDEITWYSNSINGTSWSPAIIDAAANSAASVHAADVDGDGDIDVMSAYGAGGTHGVAWYRNNGSQVFAKNILTTAATGAYAVYTADLNSDGVMDILAAAETADQLLWYRQSVNSLFSNQTATQLSGAATVANGTTSFADYDMDGDFDLLIAGDNTAALYRNDGSGTFSDVTGSTITTPLGYAIDARLNNQSAWGDFDGDGDLDLLYGGDEEFNTTSQRSWLLRNDGGGQFSDGTPAGFPGTQEGTFNWVDFDNDGDLDISVNGFNGISVFTQLWENTGAGFSNETVAFAPGGITPIWLGEMRWADFDNDGDQDFLIAGTDDGGDLRIQLYRNGTTGTVGTFAIFASFDAGQLSDSFPANIAWGDYDADGDHDFIVSWYEYGVAFRTRIYRNTAGSFNDVTATAAPGLPQVTDGDLSWVDYDNDGDLDLMVTGVDEVDTRYAQLWRNSGGVFSYHATALNGIDGVSGSSVAWADVDLDADLDLAITGIDGVSTHSELWINGSSTGNLTPSVPSGLSAGVSGSDVTLTWSSSTDATTPTASLTYNVYVGTATLSEDIVPSNANILSGFRRISSTGNAGFGTTFQLYGLPSGTYFWSVQAIDNGFVSSAFAAEGTFTISGGIFTDVTATLAPGLPANMGGSASWGDYDNDNDKDLLILGTGISGNVTQIWRNGTTGSSGVFTDQTATLAPGLPQLYNYEADWGDYDNDGDLDLIFAARDNALNSVSAIWRNGTTGTTGTFTDVTASVAPGLPPTSLGGVQWGDYDNDGDLDFVMIGYNTYSTQYVAQIWRNGTTGASGTFNDQTSTIAPGLPTFVNGSLKWVDFDKDNDLDLFITGDNGGPLISQLWRNGNTGASGVFTNFYSFSGLHYSDQSWGDYDNDGDLDLLLFGSNGGTWVTNIYRNENGVSFPDVTGTVAPGISGTSNGSANWIDYDNDGDLDLQINGNNAGFVFEIWENGGGTFSNVTNSLISGIALVSSSTVNWADFNNDSKIDFYISGYDGANYFAQLWQNGTVSANSNPTVPTGLSASVTGSSVVLSWNASTDGTPSNALSYNVRVGTGAGLGNVVAPNANTSTGYFKLSEIGNAQLGTSFKLENLASGTYTWSVQAIDNGFVGSTFAAEGTFTISGGADWATAAGGSNNEYGVDIASDASGNVYTVGHFTGSGDFDPSAGGVQNLSATGKNDVFVIKQDPSGAFNWAARIGGPEDEYASSVAADGSGNVFVAGHFTGTTDIMTMSATSQGSTDAFVAKLNSSGFLDWHRTFGSVNTESITAMTVDNSGNVYVAGHFAETLNVFGTNLTSNGEYDLFIIKFSNAGAFLWANRYGGPGSESVNELAADASGNIYATGGFTGNTDFSGSVQTNNGLTDAFVAKLDGNGNVIWLNKFGGVGHDRGWGITVDGGGNVYATGEFSNTVGALTSNGGYDVWVVKFNSGGGQTWSQRAGGAQNDMGFAVGVDGSGNVYVAGGFMGANSPYGGFNLTPYGDYDGFVFKMDNTGAITQADRVGSGTNDYCRAACIGLGSFLITGYFHSFTANFDPASLTPVSGQGNADLFIISISN